MANSQIKTYRFDFPRTSQYSPEHLDYIEVFVGWRLAGEGLLRNVPYRGRVSQGPDAIEDAQRNTFVAPFLVCPSDCRCRVNKNMDAAGFSKESNVTLGA